MGGRIRSLKPSWRDDEKLSSLSDAARVLSCGLITLADDYGRGRGSVAHIAATVWGPQMVASPAAVLKKASLALDELVGAGYTRIYCVRGQTYFEIINWDKHQYISHPGKPQVPAPCEDSGALPEDFRRISGESPEACRSDLDLGSGSGREEERDEAEHGLGIEIPPVPMPVPPALGKFLTDTWPDIKPAKLDALHSRWADACPAVDLLAEAKKAAAWELAQPPAKQRRDHARFLTSWFVRTQERAASSPDGRFSPPPPSRHMQPVSDFSNIKPGKHDLRDYLPDAPARRTT